MNNILPRSVSMHLKFDLKGSTYKRRASKKEREKSKPTFKDLDFLTYVPEGLTLDQDTFSALVKTLQRDCLVRKREKRKGLVNLCKIQIENKTVKCMFCFMLGSGEFQNYGLQFAAWRPQQEPCRERASDPGLPHSRGGREEACRAESLVFHCYGVHSRRVHMQGHTGPRRHVSHHIWPHHNIKLTHDANLSVLCLEWGVFLL